MTDPRKKTLLEEISSTVSVSLLDPLGKSIDGLRYQILEGEKIVAKGITDAQGNITSFISRVGAELTVHVQRFGTDEMKHVKTLKPWNENFRVKLLSGKVKEIVAVKKDAGAPGQYQRKTYLVKKNDTLGILAPQFGTTAAALAELNGIKTTDIIYVDQVLKVPRDMLKAAAPSSAPPGASSSQPKVTPPTNSPTGAAPVKQADIAPPAQSSPPTGAPEAGQAEVGSDAAESKFSEPLAAPGGADSGAPNVEGGAPTASDSPASGPAVEDSVAGPIAQSTSPFTAEDLEEPSAKAGPPNADSATAPIAKKVIPINNPVSTTTVEDRGENGTPKVTVSLACDQSECIKLDSHGPLVEEINIRLMGFGGTVLGPHPMDKFTSKTESAVKQFQRDYMKVSPTGNVCAAVLRSIDAFGLAYPVDLPAMRCRCGHCGPARWGNGRTDSEISLVRKGTHVIQGIEHPGMHRGILWMLKAAQFYTEMVGVPLGYKYLKVSSAYRCWEDNRQHPHPTKAPSGRRSTNHMGKALDILFSTTAHPSQQCENEDKVDEIRKKIFLKYFGATLGWIKDSNLPALEPRDIADTWIHIDIREYHPRYLHDKFFVTQQAHVNGLPLVEFAKSMNMLKLINCGGIPPSAKAATDVPVNASPPAKAADPVVPPVPPSKPVVKPAVPPAIPPQPVQQSAPSTERVKVESLSFSKRGMDFLCTWEGFRDKPYDDSNHFCTIGYGHLIGRARCKTLAAKDDPEYLKYKNGTDEPAARALFQKDLKKTESVIKNQVMVPLYQQEYDALVCLIFNIGGFSVCPKLLSKLNTKHYSQCATEFLDIAKNEKGETEPGLVLRRKSEFNVFMNDTYNAKH